MKKVVASCLLMIVGWAAFAAEPTISINKVAQRYPWNGMVDFEFTITGDSGVKYETSFSAKDMAANEALTMSTILKSDGTPAAAKEKLLPGTYKWVWNAQADLADGWKGERVKIMGNIQKVWPLYMVVNLSGSSYSISYLDAVPSGGWTDTYKTTKLVLRYCPAGTFTMGTPKANDSRGIETQHKVTLSKPFYISVFETTRKQWGLVMGTSDSGTLPMANIPWLKIRENQGWPGNSTVGTSSFIGKFRSKTGKTKFDLPTEAQWEYACRAGTTTLFSYGSNSVNGDYMWYSSNSGGALHAVGGKKPNPWGLYDVHGNAFEWCLDYWNAASYGSSAVTDPKGPTSYVNSGSGTRPRIRRGGYFGGSGTDLSSSHRAYGSTDSYYDESVYLQGFRVCLTLD